jgi:uncharacterized protein YacL (UPF0231 family)
MKKSILFLLLTSALISCNTAVDQELAASKAIGYEIEDDGSKAPLYSGDMSNLAVWEAYIKAHNEQDLEAIKSMNADEGFKVYAPNGAVIEGNDAHIEFLTNWFADASPKWKMNYLIENEFTNKKGELRQWVTSGNQLTLTVDGKEVKLGQVNDALISNGKVQMFYVTERVLATDELK